MARASEDRWSAVQWVRHVFRILLGFLAAAIAAAAVIFIIPTSDSFGGIPAGELPFFLMLILVGAIYTAGLSAPFAFVMILVAEIRRITSGWAFSLIGFLTALAIILLISVAGRENRGFENDSTWFLIALLIAGAVAGIVYWAIAGRYSGAWRKSVTESRSSQE